MRGLTCAHAETTEPDAEGYALCLSCGAAIVVRLTRHIFDKTLERALDHSQRRRTP